MVTAAVRFQLNQLLGRALKNHRSRRLDLPRMLTLFAEKANRANVVRPRGEHHYTRDSVLEVLGRHF
jgi:hypothetical protein